MKIGNINKEKKRNSQTRKYQTKGFEKRIKFGFLKTKITTQVSKTNAEKIT